MPVTSDYQTSNFSNEAKSVGQLIINADDWGRDYATTERIDECWQSGALSSVSAMVFMQDSERAAQIAREQGICAGLHLNFTTPFSGPKLTVASVRHQSKISGYLRKGRFAQCLFHPGLANSFEYTVRAQYEEYSRLYGTQPLRIDGHHHMHLCMNVLVQKLLPPGVFVRRNFSFAPREKGIANHCYRKLLDSWLAASHPLTDYFFSLLPLQPERLERFAQLAASALVEVETHPINVEEYKLLTTGGSPIGWRSSEIVRGYSAKSPGRAQ